MYAFHSLTTSKAYQLRVQMVDSKGRFAEAMYDNFELRQDSANNTNIALSTGKFLRLPYGLADDLAISNGAGFSTSGCPGMSTNKAPWW